MSLVNTDPDEVTPCSANEEGPQSKRITVSGKQLEKHEWECLQASGKDWHRIRRSWEMLRPLHCWQDLQTLNIPAFTNTGDR
jgi:hypothetical protein